MRSGSESEGAPDWKPAWLIRYIDEHRAECMALVFARSEEEARAKLGTRKVLDALPAGELPLTPESA